MQGVSLIAVGGIATAVFIVGGVAQLAMGRLVEHIAPHVLFTCVTLCAFRRRALGGVRQRAVVAGRARTRHGGIYGQVTVNDIVLARYTADAWRGRVYAVRYFLVFITAGMAVATIAFLHARGGFDLVLWVTAGISFAFFAATVALAFLVSGAESRKAAVVPAE